MPPDRPMMTVLDPQAFAASTLASSEGRTAASRILESCLAGPDTPLDLIVQDLCSVPHLFEFVVSTLPSAMGLVHKILDNYPTAPAQVKLSYTSTILLRLSSFLFSLPPDLFSTDSSRSIGRHKLYVENAFLVLDSLCSPVFLTRIFTTDATSTSLLDVQDCDDDNELCSPIKRPKNQRKNRNSIPTVNTEPFHRLGIKIPSNNVEATKIAHEIVANLKSILKSYLELLLEPSLAQRLEGAYVSVPVCDTKPPPPLPQETEVIEVVEPMWSSYPMVQSLKAALYFENAEGFGDWRILIGSGAIKKLRELASEDRQSCQIVVKKIRQLSRGRFSGDNQRRLNRPPGVPIFEAETQSDLRIVYQIDVIADRDGETDRQVIKVYGIYIHTQFDHIWDALGQHLAGMGKQYQDRCMFRDRPVCDSGDVYLPASFSPEPESLLYEVTPTPLLLSEEDTEKLHSLVLDKYVAFSQGLLHSLIANRDAQHFLELSPHERRIVECTTSCFVLGRSGTGKTTTMLFKMVGIQRAWEREGIDMPRPRQIFVTKSRVLAAKVEECYMKLLETSALAEYSRDDLKRMRAQTTEFGLVDADDIERVDIPQKYSALEENHFPLFVTFDQLASMIAADVLDGDDPEVQRVARLFKRTGEINAQDLFVTYEVFATAYWPRFPQSLTKGLEPWLVFSEFIGIIKGSEKSLSCPGGVLDEETYCTLSTRSNPVFANQRQTLYALFKAYCRLKQERRHHDAADRTYAILKTLLDGIPLKGKKVEYIYIDEAQDNLLIDALLLRLICRNPEGLFWAGDTAQTISAGSSFRFDDLKAFVHRIERDQHIHLLQNRSVHDPVLFQLTTNYRSHWGIVNCAHSVIERITRFWPDAIDRLQPERSEVIGFKPFFLRGWGQEASKHEQFLFGESGNRIDFGANQCILVRDQKAVDKLREEVGDIGVIMTLYDSKGLEFNDVLLYNFFEDSAIDVSRWEVLLNYADGIVDGRDITKMRVPSFERNGCRFAGVCSELKSLYVGITRARKKLWIFDKSDKSEPMRMIWTARDQVDYPKTNVPVPHLAVSSTREEWECSANELFKHKKYQQAMHCFTRASLPRMAAICEAFRLREVARRQVGVASQEVQRHAFHVAAHAFMKSANDAPSGKDKLHYYHNAAECYVRAEDHRRAANSYLSAEEYTLAARQFRKAGLFSETLDVLHMHSQDIPSETSDELYTVCRLFYCSKNGASRPRLPLFPSFEEELEFLEDYDLDFARATLLEIHGKYLDAAQLHLAENRPLDAIRTLLKDRKSYDAAQGATKIMLDTLWHKCSFAVSSKEVAEDPDVIELLNLAHELPIESLCSLDHDEISMFRAIAQMDLDSLKKLSQMFIEGGRHTAALLALDHVFGRFPVLKSFTLLEMSQFLDKFREYVRLVHSIVSHTDPLSDSSIRRLFCIAEISNTEYGMARGSFLHNSATNDPRGAMYLQPSVSKVEMVTALRKYLEQHLRQRIVKENELCCASPVFLQCLTFIVTGQCNRINCPQEHVRSTELDPKRYNLRISIHLQQICVLQMMYSICPHLDTRRENVLHWVIQVYDAFNPQSYIQGSTADLNLSMLPGVQESLGVMKHWVQDCLYTLRAEDDRPKFLTNVLKLTSLLFAFDRSSALKCISQAPFNALRARIPQFIYPDGCYVLGDVVNLFDGSQQTCISSGLKFLKHVVKASLFVDLSVFCDCLEEVIGKICVSWNLYYDPPLDGLILPRGWLSSNKDFSSKKDIRIIFLVDVLDCVQEVLVRLQSDMTMRLYRLSHTKLTPVLCSVFISRICRALCFLTYNVRNYKVRQKVKQIFESLRTRPHYLYRRYAYARDNEYLKVMTEYDVKAEVVIVDLVQLIHKRRGSMRPRMRLQRIKDIEFTNPSDIPSLLASSLAVARSDLCADAPSVVPRLGVSQNEKAEVEEKIPIEELEEEPLDDVHEEAQELPPMQDESVLIHEHEPTEEEIEAAMKILSTYRRYRKRREALSRAYGRGLKAQRNTAFVVCLKNVYASGWRKTPYRTLYLWALPRLIVCLDKAITIAGECKSKAKGLLLKESHERLEELGKQTSKINALLKGGRNLRKKIEPNAAMHREKDVAAMKQVVMDVKAIVHGLPPPEISEEIRAEIDKAERLVMVGKQRVAKPEKPTLNTEDLVE